MPTTADRLPAGVLLAYGLPGLPLAALGLPLFILLPAFYSGEVGVSLSVVGFVLLGARLWDVVTDPLIGIATDRPPSPLGRRRPWMRAAVPPLMLAVWMLFQPPEGAGGLYLLGWSLFEALACATPLVLSGSVAYRSAVPETTDAVWVNLDEPPSITAGIRKRLNSITRSDASQLHKVFSL